MLVGIIYLQCAIWCIVNDGRDIFSVSALQPSDITAFFEPIFQQAKELRKAYSRFSSQTKVPFITVSMNYLILWSSIQLALLLHTRYFLMK